MRKLLASSAALSASNAFAQLDRAGNVIDGGGGSGGGANGLVFAFIGAGLGLVVTMFKPNLSTKFCVIAGAILGLVAGILLRALK